MTYALKRRVQNLCERFNRPDNPVLSHEELDTIQAELVDICRTRTLQYALLYADNPEILNAKIKEVWDVFSHPDRGS
jgi:crotonobetainyl-CoA:carnitine CoA-transferase CaiB-like acyl-CoA transferase